MVESLAHDAQQAAISLWMVTTISQISHGHSRQLIFSESFSLT
jgi:hypothetical protein